MNRNEDMGLVATIKELLQDLPAEIPQQDESQFPVSTHSVCLCIIV